MKKIIDAAFIDLMKKGQGLEIFNDELIVLVSHGAQAHRMSLEALPVRIDAYSVIMVVRGEMTIGIDYSTLTLKKNSLLKLFSYHVIDSIRVSSDYKAYHLIIAKDRYQAIVSQTDLAKCYSLPPSRFQQADHLEPAQMNALVAVVERIRQCIDLGSRHFLYESIVRSELTTFLLELAHIDLSRLEETPASTPETRYKESIVARFTQLLVTHCRTRSEVSFYSTELCITPEYLSRIMKTYSGKSVNVWIREARLSEAKVLLRHPEYTIQQIADELTFSDQSAFGKFFKKHTGKSPLEYKKSLQQMEV
jgi:AraC-like DNA-binding protein